MWRALVLIALSMTPWPALALSCMPWTLEHSYTQAADSKDRYVIAHGKLSFPKSKLPKVDWGRQQDTPPETRFTARLKGMSLGKGGFVTPFQEKVEVVVRCAGPWCPRVTPDAPYLTFLRQTAKGYELEFDPCSTMGWAKPTPEQLLRIQACVAGTECRPKQR